MSSKRTSKYLQKAFIFLLEQGDRLLFLGRSWTGVKYLCNISFVFCFVVYALVLSIFHLKLGSKCIEALAGGVKVLCHPAIRLK